MESNVIIRIFLLFSMIFLGTTMSFCLLRGILGPRFTDRVLAVNVISCKTILLIAALAAYSDKSYLLDVCLIYAMISFLAVVVLSKNYVAMYKKKKEQSEDT